MMLHLKKKQSAWWKKQGEKAVTVARKLGVTNKTMCRWTGEYRQNGEQAFPGKGHLKPDDAELRRLKR